MSDRRKISLNLVLATLGIIAFAHHTHADPINWRHSIDAAKMEANRTGKLVLIHFYSSSCGPCKKLEADVFSQPQVAASMEQNFIPVKLNADQSPAYANSYQVTRVPFEVVLNSQGNVVQKLNCPLDPNSYEAQLVNVAQHYQSRSANRTASAQAPVNSAYAGLRIGQPAVQKPMTNQAAAPAITTNPYVNAVPAAASKEPTTPPAPAYSAASQSYGDRYAQLAPTTPPMAQPPADYPPVAKAPMTPPAVQNAAPVTTSTQPSVVASTSTKQPSVDTAPIASAPIVAEVWPPELPPGTPPLAFEGYCPVSLREAKKWVRGKKTLGAIHRGRTYLFAGETERQKFLASLDASDSYSPVFSGNDPVKLLDDQEQLAGTRKYGFEYRGAFYLFSSKETMERFARQPDRYSAGVRQAMTRMDAAADGTVRR